MKARLLWFVCLLTAAGLILTSAQQVKYLQLGGKLELDITSVTGPITGVLWKHGPNKVTEWDQGFGPLVDYYGTYKNRTELVKATGKLVVNSMTIEDLGIYSVEVNGRVQSKTYKPEFIKDVPKPEVVVKPLSCSPASIDCTLVCEGNVTERGPVTYHWKKDEVSDSTQTRQFKITKAKEGEAETFSCVMKNPFSEMQSEPIRNPLHDVPPPVPIVGLIIGVLAVIVAIPFVLLFGVKCIDSLNKMVPVSVRDRLPGPLKSWLFPPKGPGVTDPTTVTTTDPTDPPASGGANGVSTTVGTEDETKDPLLKEVDPTTNSIELAPATPAVGLADGSAGREENGGNPPVQPAGPASNG